MNNEIDQVVDIWKKSYSDSLPEKNTYQSTEQLKRLAALFSPGRSFYYIVNFHDLKFEFVSDEIEEMTGFSKEEVEMKDLLTLIDDLPTLQKKEAVVKDFVLNHIQGDDLMNYKIIYTYGMIDPKGEKRTMLLQNVIISITEDGNVQHCLGIHTDVTHLKMVISNTINIVNLSRGPSYYNIGIDTGTFHPENVQLNDKKVKLLSPREREIAQLMAKGYKGIKIADELNISTHTLTTHRKNMLKKLRCSNSTELIVLCLAEGVVKL